MRELISFRVITQNNGIVFSSWVVMPLEFLSAPPLSPPALSCVQINLFCVLFHLLREVPRILAHVVALPLLLTDRFFFWVCSLIHWPKGDLHFNSCTEKLKEILKFTLKSGYINYMPCTRTRFYAEVLIPIIAGKMSTINLFY